MKTRVIIKHLHYLLLTPLFVLLFLSSCKPLSEADKIKEEAKNMVEKGYEALLDGRYDQFLALQNGSEELPADYREQLIASYKQSMALQQEEHRGITSFHVSDVHIDSLQNLVEVFVVVNYADSIQEEFLVPVVKSGETWKMK